MSEQAQRRSRLRESLPELREDMKGDDAQSFLRDLTAELDATELLQWMDEPTKAGWYWVMGPNDSEGHGPHYVWQIHSEWVFGEREEHLGGMQRCAGPLKPPRGAR